MAGLVIFLRTAVWQVRPDFDGSHEDRRSLLLSTTVPDVVRLRSRWLWPGARRRLIWSGLTSPSIAPSIAPSSGPLHRILHLFSLPDLAPSLFREGPFNAVTPHPRIGDKQGGCPYRFTSYRDNDYLFNDGLFGVQVNHPQFLEWVGAPESARLLGRAPGEWIRSLNQTQTLDVMRQLQHDASLMTSNLSVLDQYALSFHGAASDLLHLIVGCPDFPSAAVNDAAPVPRVRRSSTYIEAMGLWRPPHRPGGPALEFFHQGPQCTGCPTCGP